MPQISIIVPVYKVEQYLDRCIKSILDQTFKDFELILVDDGSPDRCPQMCDEWAEKDERIKVIHKENGGLSSARNRGLEIYKGSYVFFVDSDDWIEKEALNVLYQIAVNTKADIVVGNHCDDSEYYVYGKSYDLNDYKYYEYDKDTYLDMYLKITEQKTRYYAWAKLYSAKVASCIHYSEGYKSEDIEGTFYAIANAECIIETDYIVYHYFVNKEGITKSPLTQTYKDIYHSWNQVITYSRDNLPEYIGKCEYNLIRTDLLVLISFIIKPISKEYRDYLFDVKLTKYRLDNNFFKIMKGPLPRSKKAVLIVCRIIPAFVFCFFARVNYNRN